MSELTLKLIVILVPGALAVFIYNRLTTHKEWSSFIFTTNAIILGFFSYLCLQIFVNIPVLAHNIAGKGTSKAYTLLQTFSLLSDSKLIPYREVFYSSVFSVLLAYLWSYINQRRFVNRLAQYLKISWKYGDENLYSHFLEASDTHIVYIRNPRLNLTYRGQVRSFAETETISEISLANVTVYSYDNSDVLYEVEKIYLSFNKADIIIEQSTLITHE
jgi:hypothetical protein